MPESSVWIQQASNKENVQNMMPDLQPSLARSPNVIAMPKTLAVALGWPNTNFDWPDIVNDMNKPNFWSTKVKGVGGTFKFTMTDRDLVHRRSARPDVGRRQQQRRLREHHHRQRRRAAQHHLAGLGSP